jgi:ketopantoate reductase
MFVIGKGRIGGALEQRSPTPCTVLLRGDDWRALATSDDPIVVTTRNDDLDGVLDRVPEARRRDVVLIQNGMLRPWLAERGGIPLTRGLLFFAVASAGATPEVGGLSPFVGPHAEAMVRWLESMSLDARVVSERHFREIELEKLVWNSAFGLLCEACDASVGEVVEEHASTFTRLAAELIALGADALEIEVNVSTMLDSLAGYSRSIADYRGAVKEFRWRNGWFVGLAQSRGAWRRSDHHRLLEAVGKLPAST